jgi:hypothetical protein
MGGTTAKQKGSGVRALIVDLCESHSPLMASNFTVPLPGIHGNHG